MSGAGDFTAGSTAVPEALRGRFDEEPLYYDLRWARDVPDLSLRLSRFRGAVAQVASTIHGVAPDDLEGEDVRLHRRARRLARGAVASLVVLGLLAATAAVVAVRNAQRADRRAREAIARQVGLQALDEPASALDRAMLLSLAAAGLDEGAGNERFRAGRTLIGRYSRLDAILPTGEPAAQPGSVTSVRGLAFAPDGQSLAGAMLTYSPGGPPSGTTLRWDVSAATGRTQPVRASAPAGPVAFVADRQDLAVGGPGTALTLVPAAGQAPQPVLSPSARAAAVRAEDGRALLVDGPREVLVDLTTGRRLAALADAGVAPILTSSTAVLVSDGALVVLDAVDGTERVRTPVDAVTQLVATVDSSHRRRARPGAGWRLDAPALAPGTGRAVRARRSCRDRSRRLRGVRHCAGGARALA